MAATSGSEVSHSEVLVTGISASMGVDPAAVPGARSVRIAAEGEIVVTAPNGKPCRSGETLFLSASDGSTLTVVSLSSSHAVDDRALMVEYLDHDSLRLLRLRIVLTSLTVRLDVDADRDGRVDDDHHPAKHHWRWGSRGAGAILLVNNDHELVNIASGATDRLDPLVNGAVDLEDMSEMIVRRVGPSVLPPGCEFRLQVTDAASQRVRIFAAVGKGARQLIGPGTPQATLFDVRDDMRLAVEGLQYPDREFTGLVTIDLVLGRGDEELYRDRVVFRVAPWQMVSSIAKPLKVYVCRIEDGSNADFIHALRAITAQAGVELVEVPPGDNQGDRWIQDEIELGYSHAPRKTLPVVLDSPRNRRLGQYPKTRLLGEDFGYVTRENPQLKANSLDSFGNLDVSPPLGDYPLGRVIFGGALPSATAGRRVMTVVREFLYSQAIQSPVEVYSDWLLVGHIDEFMAFVPAKTSLGFKLVLASPNACYRLFHGLAAAGHGAVLLFADCKRVDDRTGKPTASAERTLTAVLNDAGLAQQNARYQAHIDWNRQVLRESLRLEECDIIDLPALYEEFGAGRAVAYFPNMVNMIVLGEHLVLPRPHGPTVDGRCQLEAYAADVFGREGLRCHFIDDWYPYFTRSGGVHCGTNVLRERPRFPWWQLTTHQSEDERASCVRLRKRRGRAPRQR